MSFFKPGDTVVYCLAQRKYFMEGVNGRTTHAVGFVEGLVDNGIEVLVISGPGAQVEFSNHPVRVIESNLPLMKILLALISIRDDRTTFIFRWRPLLSSFVSVFKLLARNNPVFELNSITSYWWKNSVLKKVARIDIILLAKNFKVLTVSDSNKELLLEWSGFSEKKARVTVIKNGFRRTMFRKSSVNKGRNEGSISLVYFGTMQPYYDWNLLAELSECVPDNSVDIYLYGVGSDSNFIGKAIKTDRMAPDKFIEKIKKISNPVLLLHGVNTNYGAAGSPMKLYEYAVLGYPIVAADTFRSRLDWHSGAVFYKAGSLQSMKEALEEVDTDYSRLLEGASLSSNEAAEKYSWEGIVRRQLICA